MLFCAAQLLKENICTWWSLWVPFQLSLFCDLVAHDTSPSFTTSLSKCTEQPKMTALFQWRQKFKHAQHHHLSSITHLEQTAFSRTNNSKIHLLFKLNSYFASSWLLFYHVYLSILSLDLLKRDHLGSEGSCSPCRSLFAWWGFPYFKPFLIQRGWTVNWSLQASLKLSYKHWISKLSCKVMAINI